MQYTYKDYEAIFEYLKTKATELSDGQWTDFSDGDFGTIIIHLLSYWGDLLSNQLDLTAAELFVSTAEERTSLMEIVKLIGYEPSHYQSSVAYLDLKFNRDDTGATQTPYTIPAYTRFNTINNDLSFYNLNSSLISEEESTITVYEGTKINKNFNYDDIDEYGRISLNDYQVGTNTVSVYMTTGGVVGKLNKVTDVRFTTGELCFSVHVSLDGIPYIQFPTFWKSLISDPATIEVIYLQTNGVDGRVGANQIIKAYDSNLNNYTITNLEPTVGGYDPESVSEIKTKASVFARTMYTCVTLKDFEDMSVFVDDIAQVKALDYNNDESEFPPTINAYKQPSPPNGVPNDAYKVLIMAVPIDTATQTIFNEQPDGGPVNYGDLTLAAKQLHEIYWDRKAATLYVEYRDPVYINPWLIMNVYMDKEDLRVSSIAQNIVDFLKVRYNRARISIGQSIYGSRIGKEILNNFSYVDYIEMRDPEYNVEAKPYEFIDMTNGYYQLFINDSLRYVPRGMMLRKLKIGDVVRLKDENGVIRSIDWASKDIYDGNNAYIPNSYEYIWSKETGNYPRLDLKKVGVSYEDNNSVMVLAIPEGMLDFGLDQTFNLNEEHKFLHIYNEEANVSDLTSFNEYGVSSPSYAVSVPIFENGEDGKIIGADVTFNTSYTGELVKEYHMDINQKITITAPNGEIYSWTNNGVRPTIYHRAFYWDNSSDCYYIPEDWEVTITGE